MSHSLLSSMTSQLPPEILARIVRHKLQDASLPACLQLRLVNKYFSQEVYHVLFDLGEVDRRLYRAVIKRKDLDPGFAETYWLAFLRKRVVLPKRFRRGRNSRLSANSRILDDPEITSGEDSRATASNDSTNEEPVICRRDRVLMVFQAAIALQISLVRTSLITAKGEEIRNRTPELMDETLLSLCTANIAKAAISLLGARDAFVYLCAKDNQLRHMSDPARGRHLIGKPAEFWVLMAVIQEKSHDAARKYLELFRVPHSKQQAWLARLQVPWDIFVWKSSARERQWLEVLCASLQMASKTGAKTFFEELLCLEPGIISIAFKDIRINSRNILEQTISSGHKDLFMLLIDKGWSLLDLDSDHPPSAQQYPRALKQALDLPSHYPTRHDIIRMLLIMTNEWQHKKAMDFLLSTVAVHNDPQLGEMILALMVTGPVSATLNWTSSTWPRPSTEEVLSVAARHKHFEALSFLLRNRRILFQCIPSTSRMTDRSLAVTRIVQRGEPVPLDCLEEILRCSHDLDFSHLFVDAAGELDPDTVACFARNITLDHKAILDLNEFRDDVSSCASAERVDAVSATPGEKALANALRNLKVNNARLLIEQFGVKLTWGSVRGLHVWEYEEMEMKALAELRQLLAEHEMFMETKLIYAPSFHPAGSTSTTEFGKHDKLPDEDIILDQEK